MAALRLETRDVATMWLGLLDHIQSGLPTSSGDQDGRTLTEIGRMSEEIESILSGAPAKEVLGDTGVRDLAMHNYASAWTLHTLTARGTRLGRILRHTSVWTFLAESASPGSVLVAVSSEGTSQLSIYPDPSGDSVLFRFMSTDVPCFRGIDAVKISRLSLREATEPDDTEGLGGIVRQLSGEWLP